MAAPFCRETWSKDFETLGISSAVVEMFQVRLLELENLYSASIVWGILNSERIRTIAGWVLKSETAEYSIEWIRHSRVRGDEGTEEEEKEEEGEEEDEEDEDEEGEVEEEEEKGADGDRREPARLRSSTEEAEEEEGVRERDGEE